MCLLEDNLENWYSQTLLSWTQNGQKKIYMRYRKYVKRQCMVVHGLQLTDNADVGGVTWKLNCVLVFDGVAV